MVNSVHFTNATHGESKRMSRSPLQSLRCNAGTEQTQKSKPFTSDTSFIAKMTRSKGVCLSSDSGIKSPGLCADGNTTGAATYGCSHAELNLSRDENLSGAAGLEKFVAALKSNIEARYVSSRVQIIKGQENAG